MSLHVLVDLLCDQNRTIWAGDPNYSMDGFNPLLSDDWRSRVSKNDALEIALFRKGVRAGNGDERMGAGDKNSNRQQRSAKTAARFDVETP